MAKEPKNQFVQLANTWNKKDNLIGRYLSEKLDGQRCLWDGGWSRGKLAMNVPFANQEVNKDRVATGLWSRLRNPIHAPQWFLDSLPQNVVLDGELIVLQNGQQTDQTWPTTRRAVSMRVPDSEKWESVEYHVFDSPVLSSFVPENWVPAGYRQYYQNYEETQEFLQNLLEGPHKTQLKLVEQILLGSDWASLIETRMEAAFEGLMIRDPNKLWLPHRNNTVLKCKKYEDAECTVIGLKAGQGKYQGMLGSATCEFRGKIFNLSGMTDEQRVLVDPKGIVAGWGVKRALPETVTSPYFRRGGEINFQYRGLSADGIPLNPRYHRESDKSETL